MHTCILAVVNFVLALQFHIFNVVEGSAGLFHVEEAAVEDVVEEAVEPGPPEASPGPSGPSK